MFKRNHHLSNAYAALSSHTHLRTSTQTCHLSIASPRIHSRTNIRRLRVYICMCVSTCQVESACVSVGSLLMSDGSHGQAQGRSDVAVTLICAGKRSLDSCVHVDVPKCIKKNSQSRFPRSQIYTCGRFCVNRG